MSSLESKVVAAMFRALREAEQGKAGWFKVQSANENGIAMFVAVAVDEMQWLQHVEPCLRAAGIHTEQIK